MWNEISRRQWFMSAAGVTLAGTGIGKAMDKGKTSPGADKPAFPGRDSALVFEMVRVSHFNLKRVRELIELSPSLARASWDWAFGDWESALGAASHTGNVEIAKLLIEKGARPDLYTFAMLGNLKAVKAIIESSPGIQRDAGPHGISLLSHARRGYARSQDKRVAEVIEYLEALGDADPQAINLPMTDANAYAGKFDFGHGVDKALEVKNRKDNRLAITRGDSFFANLNHAGDHTFHPSGAPDVRIHFAVEGGRATTLTIHDRGQEIIATRIP